MVGCRPTPAEELRQTARAGLIAAIDRYDPNYGNPFVPYAVACVVGETSATCVTPAGGLGVAEEEVLEALAVAQSRQELSLDRPIGDDTARCLSDLVAAPSPPEEPEDLLALPQLIAALPELNRRVIVLRFFHDLGQDAIAADIGYSQMQVSRLLRRALASLRAQLLDS